MVKNLPSVERSQKIRLGKFTPDVQATDTIVINATSADITTLDSGLYVAPIRYDATPGVNAKTVGYDTTTKEIVQTSFPVNQTQGLQEVTSNGAVTTLGVEVSNTLTATRMQIGSGASADDINVFVVRGGVLIEGNLVATGDTTFVRSNNVSITDPLLELGGNNNSEAFVYDVGIIMNRPGENVGFAYLENRDELTVALTSNTATDRFIVPSSNLLTMNVVGDVYANAFFGEGSTLTNVAHLDDFLSNVTRVENLETSLSSNNLRVGYLETVHASNAVRLTTLEQYHDDNVIRLNLLYNLQASNAAFLNTLASYHSSNVTRISNLETWLDDNSVRITNLSSNLADNSARISLLNTWLQDNSFRITTNSDNLSSNHYRLTNVESNLIANSNRITNLSLDVYAIDGRVTVLESETSNIRADLTSNVTILNTTIDELDSNASRVTTLELTKAPINNPIFTGIITGDGGGISNVDLQHVTSDGNATTDTVRFTSPTVAFVTDSTVGIGTDDPDTNYSLHATGNIKVQSNVEATTFVAPGTHINLDGTNKFTGNTTVYGNLNVFGNVTYLDTENVYVKDPILGIGNPGAQDSGVIAMSGGPGSNVAFGYNNTDGEFIIAFTDDGPLGVTLTPDPSRDLNVHVYGTLYSANGFGVANTNPVSGIYALSIGQNVFAKHNGDLISIRSLADTGIYTSNVTTPVIESTGTNLEITAPNTVIMGNLDVRGATTMVSTTDLIVNDTVIDLANNNTLTSVDLGIRMRRPGANVIMTYQALSEELAFAHSVTGVTPDPTKTMNVHVYGNLEVNDGINVGSNVIINDFASNVIDVDGAVAASIYFGDGGLLSNITQTLQGISEIGANTDQTIFFTNVTTGINVTTSNVEVGGYYFGDGQFMSNVANLVILQSNVSILNQNIDSNVSDLRTDLQSNVSILNTNISSNVSDLRTDLQSNVSILNTNIASNVSDLRTDLQSNVSILNTNISSNVSDLRTDLQSNVSILNTNIASNVSDLRTDLQSNVSILNTNIGSNVLILNQNIASNVSDIRTDIQSNVSIINSNVDLKADILDPTFSSNITVSNNLVMSDLTATRVVFVGANKELTDDAALTFDSSTLTVDGDVSVSGNLTVEGTVVQLSTVNTIVNDAIVELGNNNSSDTLDLGIIMTRPSTNVAIGYRGDEAELMIGHTLSDPSSADLVPDSANTLAVHVYGSLEIQSTITGDGQFLSNVANLVILQSNVSTLNQNIGSNVSDLRTDLQSNVNILNTNIASNVSDLRTDLQSNVSILNTNIGSNVSDLRTDLQSNVSILNTNIASNVSDLRTDLQSNVLILNQNIASNVSDLRADIASNVGFINSNVDLKADILDPTFSSNITVSNNLVMSDLTSTRVVFVGADKQLTDSSTLIFNSDTLTVDGNVVADAISIGRPSVTGSNVLDINGSANALVYYGDGGLLSNIRTDLESVIIEGNTTSNVVQFMNATTAFITNLTSNVVMNINQLNNVTITTADLVDQQILRYNAGNGQWFNSDTDRNFIRVYNGTGTDIARGKAVYIYDSHNNNVSNVALAKSDDPSTMPSVGITFSLIANGTEGYAVSYGKVQGVNTSGFQEGETVYVSNVVAGGVSNVKPYSTINSVDQIQNIGICVKADTNGVVFVTGVGRSNDIPNANVVTSNGDLNYVYVNQTNNDMLKIGPSNLLTKLQTLTQVVNTGNTTSNVVQFTNATTGLVATSNVQAGAFYGEGSTLSFTSNVFLDEGLVVNRNSVANKQYAYTGSMTFSNVGVTFSTNVFSAKITAHLIHDDDEVSTLQIDCCGGSKNGTSAHNIVAGKVNKFGVASSYPWNHEVTTTPTQIIWEPEQTGLTNYDYDIHVELLSSHPSAGVTQITEAGSAVKYFSH